MHLYLARRFCCNSRRDFYSAETEGFQNLQGAAAVAIAGVAAASSVAVATATGLDLDLGDQVADAGWEGGGEAFDLKLSQKISYHKRR